MNRITPIGPRRRLLTLAASAALLSASPSYAFLDWIEKKAAENRKKRYEAMPDKALVDAMYVMTDDGKKEGLVPALRQAGYQFDDINLGMLAISRRVDKPGSLQSASEQMRTFVPDADADPVAAVYAAACKARGNTVKVYKPEFSRRLNGLFNQPLVRGQGRTEWYGSDLSYIEWSPEGRVVSLLLHAYQSSVSLGEMLYRHSMLLFGPANARHVENQVRNSEFAEFELRTL